MKKIIIFLMFLPIFGLSQPQVYVPDDNFEQALIDLGYDDVLDDYVFLENITSIQTLDISYSGISNLTGIEEFVSLMELNCEGNLLATLGLSNNPGLQSLNCNNNQLTSLDISDYLALDTLKCRNNEMVNLNLYQILRYLDCSNNEMVNLNLNNFLMYLDCSNNFLTNLDISSLWVLDTLNCSYNQLTDMDISNTNGITINCTFNQLTNLDVSTSYYITINCSNNLLTSINTHEAYDLSLDCSNNQLTKLNLPGNAGLIKLYCTSNQLTILNVRNGQNDLLTDFNATDNPDLTCIMVDDEDAANAGTGVYASWQKDAATVYAELCDYFTYIPDNSFEQALINLGYDDIIDYFVLTENIDTITNLDISSSTNIQYLTGIQNFAELTHLNCSGNLLATLGLSSNNIQSLNCADNNLSLIELGNNTVLNYLDCSGNNLTMLDFSTITTLEYLNCSDNQSLMELNCEGNLLATLGLSNNQALQSLNCSNNQLTSLDISDLCGLDTLKCCYNGIVNLNLNQSLRYVDCCNNGIINLDLNDNLRYLDCSNNFLINLEISSLEILETVNCSNNQLTYLDVSNSHNLTINCSNNLLTSINAHGAYDMSLDCSNNQLTGLNLNSNTGLNKLHCNSNQLTILNVRNGQNDLLTDFNATDNPDLTCIMVDDEDAANAGTGVYATWQKDAAAVYAELCDYFTYIPDNNFEQALINLGYDDIIDYFVLTENIDTITNLDISSSTNIQDLTGIQNFTALTHLNCTGNNITNLDLSSNNIQSLNCADNNLSLIELGNNTVLNYVNCSANHLTLLNFSLITSLAYLDCSDNQLTILNVKNGNNPVLVDFYATLNPDLTCIQVDDEDAANGGTGVYESWQRDATATYAEDCIYYTYIPDDNFENELINLGYDDLPDDYVFTDNITQITELYIDNLNISNLTGIENFNSLVILNCYDNLLTELNLSNNTNLEFLNCSDNQLTTLQLGNNQFLSTLNCSGNQLSSLNLNDFTELQYLHCSNNSITTLDLSNNTGLENLTCNNNQLTLLDVKNGNNLVLTYLNATENPYLTCIQVDDEEAANLGSGVYGNWQTDDIITYSEDCDYTGINKNNEQAFILYPNPCKDVLYIDCNDNINFISIYNNFGKLIAEYQKTNIIQLADLTPGIYFIKVFTEENCFFSKFIKE